MACRVIVLQFTALELITDMKMEDASFGNEGLPTVTRYTWNHNRVNKVPYWPGKNRCYAHAFGAYQKDGSFHVHRLEARPEK
jgi:hypothetical protein